MPRFKLNDKVLIADPFGELMKGFISELCDNGYRIKITSKCVYQGYELFRLENGVYEEK